MFNTKRIIAATFAVAVVAGTVAAPAFASDPFENYMNSEQYKIDMAAQQECHDDKDYYHKWLNEQNMQNGTNDVFQNYMNSEQYKIDMEAQKQSNQGTNDVRENYRRWLEEQSAQNGTNDVFQNYMNSEQYKIDMEALKQLNEVNQGNQGSTDWRENYKNSPEGKADRARREAAARDDKDFYALSEQFEIDAANKVR